MRDDATEVIFSEELLYVRKSKQVVLILLSISMSFQVKLQDSVELVVCGLELEWGWSDVLV